MTGHIHSTVRAGGIVALTISNPSKRNALTVEMWRDLRQLFSDFHGDSELRCVLIAGHGADAFSAGADISQFASTRATPEQTEKYHEEIVGPCLKAIADCPAPVVAKLRGHVMGGGLEIAGACDLRIGDTSVLMGAPVGRLGFALAFGETQSLFNLVGYSVLAEILIEGRVLRADEAAARGLLTRVVAPEDLDATVENTLSGICANSPLATRMHKQQLRRLMTDSSPVTHSERVEMYAFARSEEYSRRTAMFLRKGKPA